jgi:hypothetical protein
MLMHNTYNSQTLAKKIEENLQAPKVAALRCNLVYLHILGMESAAGKAAAPCTSRY